MYRGTLGSYGARLVFVVEKGARSATWKKRKLIVREKKVQDRTAAISLSDTRALFFGRGTQLAKLAKKLAANSRGENMRRALLRFSIGCWTKSSSFGDFMANLKVSNKPMVNLKGV